MTCCSRPCFGGPLLPRENRLYAAGCLYFIGGMCRPAKSCSRCVSQSSPRCTPSCNSIPVTETPELPNHYTCPIALEICPLIPSFPRHAHPLTRQLRQMPRLLRRNRRQFLRRWTSRQLLPGTTAAFPRCISTLCVFELTDVRGA